MAKRTIETFAASDEIKTRACHWQLVTYSDVNGHRGECRLFDDKGSPLLIGKTPTFKAGRDPLAKAANAAETIRLNFISGLELPDMSITHNTFPLEFK